MLIVKYISLIGRNFISFVTNLGKFTEFVINATVNIFIPPFYFKNFLRSLIEIGFYSLPVVGLTALFSGMVLALQSYIGFARFSAEGAIANVLAIAITREIGPVFAGLMVSGRIAASMSAEIGTMRVTEQIDAIKTLSVNPIKYLVAPRILAGIIALPFLVAVADVLGILGGFIVAVFQLDFNAAVYVRNTWDFLTYWDIMSGIIKASFFGYIVTIMGCYHGYNSQGGAKGVGSATTNAVVSSSILILIFNYFLTQFFFTSN